MSTIIVLLILAGVSLSLVAGGDGIIEKADNAVSQTNIANAKEAVNLYLSEAMMEYYSGEYLPGGTKTGGTLQEYINNNIVGNIPGYTIEKDTKGNITVKDKNGNELAKGGITTDGTINWGTLNTTEIGTVTPPEPEVTVITAADIAAAPATYYGKTIVNYGAAGDEGYDAETGKYRGVNWKIFNVSGNKVQLIADDYVDVSGLPTVSGINLGTADGLDNNYHIKSSSNRATLKNYINTESNWTSFKPASLGSKVESVKGGPSVEEFQASYNATHPANEDKSNQIVIGTKTDMSDGIIGYYVNWGESAGTNYYIEGLANTLELNYYHSEPGKAYAYWLGTGSADDIGNMMGVNCVGILGNNASNNANLGLCPLVSLSSGITFTEDSNGNLIIQ